jgi:hypothetical protein
LIRYFGRAEVLEISRWAEIISCNCFAGCKLLERIPFEIDSRLEMIEASQFRKSGLKAILVIPRSVKVISQNCFESCGSLESVTTESDSQLETIGEYAFKKSGLRKIVIPASVHVIGYMAFCGSESLESVKSTLKQNSSSDIAEIQELLQ